MNGASLVTSVGVRGQITIPKKIREKLRVNPKDVAVAEIEEDHLVIHFLPAPHKKSLRGILSPKPSKPIKDWGKTRDSIEKFIAAESSD